MTVKCVQFKLDSA